MIEFKKGRAPLPSSSDTPVMTALLEANIPVASSCGGEGVCKKCKIQIISGSQNLSPYSRAEVEAQITGKLEKNERLSCQVCVVKDSVTIDTTYW